MGQRGGAMSDDDKLFIGTSVKKEYLELRLANRHGLVAGATGTGKTVTLQILAEGFSKAGVPMFCADVKGDLSGIAEAGVKKDFLEKRAKTIGFDDFVYEAFPVIFWDLFGKQGHPIRTTVSEMGPLLLSSLMGLNETQEGVLNIAFRLADDEGLLLLDLKDLRSLLVHVSERSKELTAEYGTVSRTSVGAIQRRLLVLEEQGGHQLFGEPALDIKDLMRTNRRGEGYVNVLAADKLMQNPRLYSSFLLWLMSELFEELPEVGDPDRPKLVFFFDEAHLLFDEAPKALLDKVEQVVRLIRSKGVGVYFVTQNPLDVPDSVASQLGNRIQHALRAFTRREQRAVKAAAETFRPNPELDEARVIMELGVGEALVSVLSGKGVPSVVQRTLIRPPSSRLGPLKKAERKAFIQNSPVLGEYDDRVDRRSAYEVLKGRAAGKADKEDAQRSGETRRQTERRGEFTIPRAPTGRPSGQTKSRSSTSRRTSGRSSQRQSTTEALTKSAARSLGTALGRALARGILGSLKRGL